MYVFCSLKRYLAEYRPTWKKNLKRGKKKEKKKEIYRRSTFVRSFVRSPSLAPYENRGSTAFVFTLFEKVSASFFQSRSNRKPPSNYVNPFFPQRLWYLLFFFFLSFRSFSIHLYHLFSRLSFFFFFFNSRLLSVRYFCQPRDTIYMFWMSCRVASISSWSNLFFSLSAARSSAKITG